MRTVKSIMGVVLLGVLCLVGACGSGGPSDGPAVSDEQSKAFLEANKVRVEKFLSDKGTFLPPPAEAPKPTPGKRIALVSCGSTVIPACGTEIDAAKDAAEAAGWETTLIDSPTGDPVALGPGISSAVSSGVDGIFMYYVDCKYVRSALEGAKAADIPVVNSSGVDCNADNTSADALFSYSVKYNVGDGTATAFANEVGAAQADYAMEKLDGKAKIAMFGDNTSEGFAKSVDATKAEVEKCGGCTFESMLVPIGDIGTKLQGKAESFFLKNPQVNAVLAGYSDILPGGLAGALRSQAGRELLVSVADGGTTGMQMIKDGSADFGVGFSLGWEGWAGIDSLNRIFNGESPSVNSGIGIQLFDKDHNFPWQPPYDYEELYRTAWGVN